MDLIHIFFSHDHIQIWVIRMLWFKFDFSVLFFHWTRCLALKFETDNQLEKLLVFLLQHPSSKKAVYCIYPIKEKAFNILLRTWIFWRICVFLVQQHLELGELNAVICLNHLNGRIYFVYVEHFFMIFWTWWE